MPSQNDDLRDLHFSSIFNSNRWRELARQALDDRPLSPDDGLAILRSDDRELLDLLAAAYLVRHRWFGNRVDLNFLINAKSGLCGEDCGYCSQSRVSKAEIARYPLVSAEEVLEGADKPPSGRPKPTAPSFPAARPSIGNSTPSGKSFRRSRPSWD